MPQPDPDPVPPCEVGEGGETRASSFSSISTITKGVNVCYRISHHGGAYLLMQGGFSTTFVADHALLVPHEVEIHQVGLHTLGPHLP